MPAQNVSFSGRGLLLDLDDTLYDYAPAERSARTLVLTEIARVLDCAVERIELGWRNARQAVKARLGETASAHSRLLYLSELVHQLGRVDRLGDVRRWERLYWDHFLSRATLRPGARGVLEAWRALGGKVAIVTDLTLEVQLWKLERFALVELIDALVTSEEVPRDKPSTEAFVLAAERLSVPLSACVIVGDSVRKDGGAAQALGLPYLQVLSSERESGGMSMDEVGRSLGVSP